MKAKVNIFCDDVICEILQQNTSQAMKKILSSSKIGIKATEFNAAFEVSGSNCLLMSVRQNCYHAMLMTKALERMSVPISKVPIFPETMKACDNTHRNTFVTESLNVPYELALRCNDAALSCHQFKNGANGPVL